jgi:phage repressor protein C with HTH and peptisase S24 domain
MLPSLRPGSIVLVRYGTGRIKQGDVVVVGHDGMEKIKRVQCINGSRLFVVGDNKEQSTDSRSFGWLDMSAVRGRVIWPRGANMSIQA